jgi:hypothetical protein
MPKFIAIMLAFMSGIIGSSGNPEGFMNDIKDKKEEIKEMAAEYKLEFRNQRGSGPSGISGSTGQSGISGESGPTGVTGDADVSGSTGATGSTGPDTSKWPAVNLRGGHEMPSFIPRVAIEKSKALDFITGTPYPTVPGQANHGANSNGNSNGNNR